MSNTTGKFVGTVLFSAAVAAIWLWPGANNEFAPDDSVRPIRSVVVKEGVRMPDLFFTGRVKANADRTLCFKQSGRIQRISVMSGQSVKKGEKLAWLDPIDFENDLAKAEAAELRDRLSCERKREAAKKNAISQEELSQAEAQLKQSKAELALARRALEDTVLVAPFDCEVAEVPATELDMVSPSSKIVLVHDLTKVKIDVVIPETLAIESRKIKSVDTDPTACAGAKISFDSVPGRQFPVQFVEFVANANAKSQTYIATYVMDAPEDLCLLPGMSATMTVRGDGYRMDSNVLSKSLMLPESAVGVNDDGSHFAWVLEESAEKGVYVARRRALTIYSRQNGRTIVSSGIKAGERVATAGVMVLNEGRKVRLLAE